MPPRVLALSRNHAAAAMRLGTVVAGVCLLSLATLVVLALSAFSGGSGSDNLFFLLMISPLLGMGGYVTWLTLQPGRVVVHADALEVVHPRMLRRPLVIPRSNVRALYIDDGSAAGAARFATGDDAEPFLWTNRSVTQRNPLRPLIGDGVMPNLAIDLVDPITIHQARSAWVAAGTRFEPDPPSPTDPVTSVMLAVQDPDAAEQALAAWDLQRPAATPVLAPELRPGQSHQVDGLLFAAAALGPVPFYTAGLWQVLPVHVVLFLLAGRRMLKRSQAGHAAAREAASSQPPPQRAAAAAAADANWGAPPPS